MMLMLSYFYDYGSHKLSAQKLILAQRSILFGMYWIFFLKLKPTFKNLDISWSYLDLQLLLKDQKL